MEAVSTSMTATVAWILDSDMYARGPFVRRICQQVNSLLSPQDRKGLAYYEQEWEVNS